MQNSTSNFPLESGKETLTNWGEAAATFSTNSISQKGQSATAQHTNYMADVSESDDDEDSEVESFHLDQGELDDDAMFEAPKYLLSGEGADSPDLHSVDPETQARLEALLEAAGIGKLSTADGKHFADPEVLRKLTSSVSCALDEAAAALSRMRAESGHLGQGEASSLTEACSDGDAGAVKKLLEEGRNVNETTEEGDSLLSLACQAGYYELAQVLLAMRANVEDRGIKGDCTPLMEAASAGHLDIVNLLISHKADVNAQSSSGNTPLMYACAGGHEDVVRCLLEAHANVEDHNENGHTPLMEAASAGHVGVAKILLEHGAGVNTHSNEFKESALTLACYKGHIEMVRFLLAAGADQEHKTDEMHTALMEASMDGHVEVARLLLDSGAQVNMPADSFESPLTLAACGGHVELAMLLLERGANIEEVNDEGYTPLMEAAREGHEEMVALLLSQGADINAQTEETAETALTLACCGGFREVAEFLIKAGANIELGASTPLMEAAQEGRLELVSYLLADNANVHAVTQTGDTALTYACENGHTDVADLLLQAGANLEHESEGGRTPLMKAARAGHYCTVQFLVSRGADVNRQTSNNDHTPLSLACAGGHYQVVEFLLSHNADPSHRLKDNSTMLIEAAKGGHTAVVQLLLDYPQSIVATSTTPDLSQISTPTFENPEVHRVPPHGMPHPLPAETDPNSGVAHAYYHGLQSGMQAAHLGKQETKHVLRSSNTNVRQSETLTTAEQQQVKNAPHLTPGYSHDYYDFDGAEVTPLDLEKDVKPCERLEACINSMMKKAEQLHHNREEQILQKQQILEELQRVERELQEKAYAQLHIEHHAVQGLVQACALASTSSAHSIGGTLLDLGQGISPEGQLGLGFKSPVGLPSLSPCILDGGQPISSAVGATLPSPAQVHDMPKPKAGAAVPGKKDNKVLKQKELKLQQQQSHQLIEEIEKLNAKGLSLSPDAFVAEAFQGLQLTTKPLSCPDHGLFERLPSLEDMVSSTSSSQEQVQSQDSAVVSVGMGMHPLQAPVPAVSSIQLQDDKVPKNKNLKSVTQIKNHMNSVTVNTIMGNLPLTTAVSIPQLPSSPQVVLSQQPFSSTTTVATQYIDPNLPTSSLTVPFLTSTAVPVASQVPLQNCPLIDVNSQTDSNHDTALTLACAGGHEELVQLLLARDANIEHRDKKGFTPLILAATAGHAGVVDILLNHGADIEAQSERTKDTPLSLACSGGRYEVVDILLNRGANKEHRNVSDYTPLSLAASGGYVNIIKLLLNHGAEINSRTGSKLGISPLMLAAMNGHTAAVKLLLDMGSDINAQIETNRNTALTLACFQGRHEVVSLLVDRKANVEHRAKTGLTPLMEAASGGYVEVGRVLLDKGADVNAPPVPSSRDTALTIAADKGHCGFVELLLNRGAQVDVKNKKGNSPLWLAANGGHLDVVQRLVDAGADIDSQDNRKVSCLMAAFRRGHIKVVKWMVKKVAQFPSDQEMTRYIATCSDNELLKKCHQCLEIIRIAKDRQAVEANKNASILFEELDMEKTREESKKAAAARRRERKRKKKKEKQERKLLEEENKKNEAKNQVQDIDKCFPVSPPVTALTTAIGTVITVGKNGKINNSQVNESDMPTQSLVVNKIKGLINDVRSASNCTVVTCTSNRKPRSAGQGTLSESSASSSSSSSDSNDNGSSLAVNDSDIHLPLKRFDLGKLRSEKDGRKDRRIGIKTAGGACKEKDRVTVGSQTSKDKSAVLASVLTTVTTTSPTTVVSSMCNRVSTTASSLSSSVSSSSLTSSHSSSSAATHVSIINEKRRDLVSNQHLGFGSSMNSEDHITTVTSCAPNSRSGKGKKGDGNSSLASSKTISGVPFSLKAQSLLMSSPKRGGKREEGWKEVVRKSKKVLVPANAISRVIGRGGCNINTIREVSGAVIEVEKQKGAGDRAIIIRGPADATRQAHQLITMMIKDPEKDLSEFLPKTVSSKMSFSVKSSGSMQSGSANQSNIAVSSGTLVKASTVTSVSKSSNLPPSGVSISSLAFPSSQPPFSAAIRQQASFRPGIAMSPAFPSPSSSSWQPFTLHPPLSNSKKNTEFGPSVSMVLSSLACLTSQSEAPTLPGSTTAAKSAAVRQLFPSEKKSAPQSVSSTCTKTTVSYTTAVIGSSKVKMVPSNSSMSFASKITDSRAAVGMGGNKMQSAHTGKAPKAGNSNMIKSSVSGLHTGQHPLPIRSTSLPNGPVSCPGVGSSPPSTITSASSSQPGTPALSPPSSLPQQLSGKPRSPTPPFQPSSSQQPVPKEYTPFSGIPSMTESVWKNKEKNFASVTAGNSKTVSHLCAIGTPVDDGPCLPPVDVAKAPGYRGNAHVSPGGSSNLGMSSLMTSDPICSSSRSCMSSSLCSTSPIGPIAPPVGSNLRKSSPPVDSLVLQNNVPSGIGPPGSVNSVIKNPFPHLGPHVAHVNIVQHGLQPQPSNPNVDLNSNFSPPSQHSPPQNHAVTYSPGAINGPSYSSSSATLGPSNHNVIPSIQSNLNPNAPDFSSRTILNNAGSHLPSQSHPVHLTPVLQHLHLFPENAVPFHSGLSAMPSFAQSSLSTQPSGISPNTMNSNLTSQAPNANLSYVQNNPQYPEYSALQRPTPGMVPNSDGHVNTARLVSGHLPPPPSAGIGTFMPLMHAQRTGGSVSHSVSSSSSCKDESSNISPVSSPHPSNPSSPMTLSGISEHSMRSSMSEDHRKLPRPIGTERAHKKTAVNPTIPETWGSFSRPASDPLLEGTHLQPNFMHFGDGLGGSVEDGHQLEQTFPQHPSYVVQRLGAGYQPYINGIHPRGLIQSTYTPQSGRLWTDNVKMNVGEPSGLSEGVGPPLPLGGTQGHGSFGPMSQPPSMWSGSNWNQGSN